MPAHGLQPGAVEPADGAIRDQLRIAGIAVARGIADEIPGEAEADDLLAAIRQGTQQLRGAIH
jgi:hypothetical protein